MRVNDGKSLINVATNFVYKIDRLLICCLVLFFSCNKDGNETLINLTQIDYCCNFDVLLVAGQSNTCSGLYIDPIFDIADTNIMQLGRWKDANYRIIKANEPLHHYDPPSEGIGFVNTFSREYISHGLLGEGRKILIIPCGKGGSGFHSHYWNKGDVLYNDAIERAKSVLKSGSGNKIVAILWHQGENDVGMKNYSYALDCMIKNMRNDIDSTQSIPFIVGGLVPAWISQDSINRLRQQDIIANTPNRVPLVGYANPYFPYVISDSNPGEAIHFSAEGQRKMGKRYFNEYIRLTKSKIENLKN